MLFRTRWLTLGPSHTVPGNRLVVRHLCQHQNSRFYLVRWILCLYQACLSPCFLSTCAPPYPGDLLPSS